MKKKELKNLAKRIAGLEVAMRTASPEETSAIMAEMMALSGKVANFDELEALDEMIQDILEDT